MEIWNYEAGSSTRRDEIMNIYDTAAFNPDIQPLQSFFDAPKMTEAYSTAHNIGTQYPSTVGGGPYEKQGLSSDVRHTLGASAGKDAFIDYISQFGVEPTGKIADLYGNVGILGATGLYEFGSAKNIAKEALEKGDYGDLISGKFLAQPWEDVKANLNAWDIPYGSTEEEKLKQIPTLQAYMQKKASKQGLAQVAMQKQIQQAEAAAAQQAAAANAAGQRRAGRGGSHMSRSRDQGGLGISRSQAQSISDANRSAGMSGWGLADGGLVYLLYGGLV